MKISSAVVTGGSGVIGTALIKRLVKEGIKVYAVCRHESSRNVNIPSNELVTRVECDIGNLQKLPGLIDAKADAFFHLAWTGTTGQSRMDMYIQNNNVRYALDSVKAAHALGCSVYVGAGSQAEYGPVSDIMKPDTPVQPISGYGMAKLCAGQMTRFMCKDLGIRHIWARILSVYGINMPQSSLIMYVISCLLKGDNPALTDGRQIWDYLFAADAAEAIFRMALYGQGGKVYVLGSGEARSMRDYVEEIKSLIDTSAELGFGKILYYKDQAMHLEADISELKKDLEWEPCINFREGISRIIEELR
ncbi:MAG: NAD(P)-dependent oxidoreductase [Selenomonas ruminantium]|nr:NAD(P)-dependent oxidoreductase [Selenomonas ruminantium]